MANYTSNLNLYKPNRNDDVPVDTSLSDNFQKIDDEHGVINQKFTDLEQNPPADSTLVSELDQYRKESPNGTFKGVWNPMDTILSTEWGVNEIPSTSDPDVVLDNMLGYMLTSSYVSRKSIGVTTNNTHNIWQYDFTPPNYEKTIILTGGLHGNEYTASLGLLRFLQQLYDNWENQPALHYLRKTVRIVAIPICNPYGFLMSTRENYNDVDLNRNFGYNWSPTDTSYNTGSGEFSEIESQHLRDAFAQVNTEEDGNVVGSLDMHTTTTDGSTEYIIYYPRFIPSENAHYVKLAKQLQRDGEYTAFATTSLATMTNYGAYMYGWNGANPEFANNINNMGYRNDYEMTRAVRWFGNLVIQLAKLEYSAEPQTLDQPQVHTMKYDSRNDTQDMTFSNTALTSQGNTTVEFRIKADSIIKVDGYAVVSLDEAQTITLIPQIYQRGHPNFAFGDTSGDQFSEFVADLPAGTHILPINADMVAGVTNDIPPDSNNGSKRTTNLVYQLRIAASGSGGMFKQIRSRLTVMPTTDGERYRRIELDGRDSTDYTPTILYPYGDGTTYQY